MVIIRLAKEKFMNHRTQVQLAEALGPENTWYCSQAYRRPVSDPCTLLTYFIKSGGAVDFDLRYRLAMSNDNKWYCSEYYGCEITDPAILWSYYKKFCNCKRPLPNNGPIC
jgi:hypothetical protein